MSEDSNRDPRVKIAERAIEKHKEKLNNCRRPVNNNVRTEVGCLGINPGKELDITNKTLYNNIDMNIAEYVSIKATSFKKGEQLTGKDGKEI